jgi:hypothetical protein
MGLPGQPVRLGAGVAYQDNTQEGHHSPEDESRGEHTGVAEGPDECGEILISKSYFPCRTLLWKEDRFSTGIGINGFNYP